MHHSTRTDACIQDLFTRQAAATPEAIAVIDGARSYTYRELDLLANRLARYLQRAGIGPESVVGCYLSRSSTITIFCLAVLKAGGAYLLLDPSLPQARLAYMITDASPQLILADTGLPADVADPTKVHPTATVAQASQAYSGKPPRHRAGPDTLAYIAYTSGSTGQPKGVLITHRAIANHCAYFVEQFRLGPTDRIPLLAPIAFDMATEEMLPPLIAGATLIVAASAYDSMESLTKEITGHAYTVLNIPAPMWHEWSAYLCATQDVIPASVRLIITGSDKIHTRSYLDWRQLPGARNVQWAAAYGTTETAVTSTFYLTAATDDLSDEPYMPIGKPIANTTTYLLNDAGQPVLQGEPGELHIGGIGLARGYHNLPQKTAASFVPDPFSGQTGARLYKTGDLARERPDGTIVCLGRRDFQVKLHGLRIELSEIETALLAQPGITEAVVVLHQQDNTEQSKQLVAYVTTENNLPPDIAALRAAAKETLHRYMVPKSIIWLDQLPLNANGKIDRKYLAASSPVAAEPSPHEPRELPLCVVY